jgi:BlaI family transcriptional regulator, penicillinase repressor
MKSLTKAEEEVMQILWDLEMANVKQVIEQMPDPKPAYNTVSTIIRILETKEVVGHKAKGKGYLYFPLIQKDEYRSSTLNSLLSNYFDGSFKSLVSAFVSDNDINTAEMDEIMKIIETKKKKS